MHNYNKSFIVMLAISFFSMLHAQTITGIVTDQLTGEPIPHTHISNNSSDADAYTDISGNFEISAEKSVDQLVFNAGGYEEVEIIASENMYVELSMPAIVLEQIVVTVNREHQSRVKAPVAISVINAATIADNKPTTIDEVLNQTAGVNMVSLGQEQHTMSIRRPIDYGASYLYLEDGIPIRASGVFNHNALLEINMANVKRVEIIKGPASSFYGSEAIGGAINFISKRPSIKPSANISLQANNIGYRRTDFSASNTFNKLGIRAAGYYAGNRNGVKDYSDFDKLALSLSAQYNLSDKTQLAWSNTLINYKSDMGGSLDSADFYSGSYGSNQTFTYRKVKSYRTKVSVDHKWNSRGNLSAIGYFRSNSIQQNPSYRIKDDYKPWNGQGDPNLAYGQENDNSFNSFGFITQNRQKFDWLNSEIIAGASIDYSPNDYFSEAIEVYKNDDGIYESFESTGEVLADYKAKITNIAGYVQAKIEPIENLNIIGALRVDNFNYNFKNHLDENAYTAVLDGENNFNKVTPKVGITYDFRRNNGLYANYSQGFVPPQVSALYVGQSIPTLKPVYYNSYEVGGWLAFLQNKAKADISIYKMDGENEIVSVLLDDGSRIRKNAGETSHKGVEFSLQLAPTNEFNFKLGGTYAEHSFQDYIEQDVDYSDNEMPQAPNWVLNSQLTYKPNALKGFRASIEWRHIDKYFMNASNSKTYDGYDIFNLRLGYRRKSIEVWTNIMNITDELYSTVARANAWGQSYSLGNPINVNVGIGYNFKGK